MPACACLLTAACCCCCCSDADTARVTVDDTDAMSAEGSETIIAETEPVTAAATEAAVPSHPLTDMFGAQVGVIGMYCRACGSALQLLHSLHFSSFAFLP